MLRNQRTVMMRVLLKQGAFEDVMILSLGVLASNPNNTPDSAYNRRSLRVFTPFFDLSFESTCATPVLN